MKVKTLLNLAGNLNIIFGVICLIFMSYLPASFLIITGLVYKAFLNSAKVDKQKGILLMLGILNIFFNVLSSICVFIAYDKIRLKQYEKIKKTDQKKNKIDFLLQLGVVLIVIAGLMIATNNNINLPNIFKVICLVCLTLVFFLLSYFSKKYLKLNSSYKVYNLLGNIFIGFIYIALGYYNLIGPLSLDSSTSAYFYPVLFIIIGILIINLKRIFEKDYILDLGILSFVFAIFFLFRALGISYINNLLLISVMASLMNMLLTTTCDITKSMNKVGNCLSILLVPISLYFLATENFIVSSLLLAILINLNIFFVYLIKKDNVTSIISPLTLILSTIYIVIKNSNVLEVNVIFIAAMLSLFYIIIKLIKIDINKIFKMVSFIGFNGALIITGITSFFATSGASIITLSIVLISNLLLIYLEKDNKLELFLEPIKSLLFVISLVIFLNSQLNVDVLLNIMIITLLELFLYLAIPHKSLKLIHYIIYLIMSSITALVAFNNTNIILVTMATILSLLPLIISEIKKETKYLPSFIISGILTLIISCNNIFSDYFYFNFICLIPLFLLLAWFKRKENIKFNLLVIVDIALIYSLINKFFVSYDVFIGLRTLVYSFIGLLIALNIKDREVKEIFSVVYFALIIIFHFLLGSFATALIISIITLSLIIISTFLDFKKLKITGIILFILNLLYQLKDYWNKIPLAIYLLVIGLILIGIVIYKEFKENK